MTKSQQIEKDLVEAMSDVSQFLLWWLEVSRKIVSIELLLFATVGTWAEMHPAIVSEIVTGNMRQHSQKVFRKLTRSSFLVSRSSFSVSHLLGGRTSGHKNKHLPPLRGAIRRHVPPLLNLSLRWLLASLESGQLRWSGKYGTLCKRSIIEERILIVIKCLKSLHMSSRCISYYFMWCSLMFVS